MVTSTNPDWAGRAMRLDPFHLPHRVSLKSDQSGGRDHRFSYTLDRAGAVLKRDLDCGLPVSIALPKRAFAGVAARVIDDGDGGTTYTLELHHADPQLCLPLLVSGTLDDIAADWHSWSRMMGLPMLIVEAGMAEPVRRQLGRLLLETPLERRKRITAPRRRPRFLRRRKPGAIGSVEKLSSAELIARR